MQDFTDLTAFIDRHGGELVTDSRAVALAFGKRHKHVIRTIERMLASQHPEINEHARTNFGLTSYADTQGKTQPMYRMTAKGMSELAMGFSGDKARVIRIRFLNAFEAVAERLTSAEKSITKMLLDHERRDLSSKAKGQVGSKLMNERRVEKRELDEEHKTLLAVAQPGLLLN